MGSKEANTTPSTSVSNKASKKAFDKKIGSVPMKASISNQDRTSSFTAKKNFVLDIEEFNVLPNKINRTEQELKYEESDSDFDVKIVNPTEIEPEYDLSRSHFRQPEKSNVDLKNATTTLSGRKRTRAEAQFTSASGITGHGV